mmetsp:Transcript_21917/g.45644  ORF Transcript_21917/g.45644 Transcript_21917/m.45644 type:complete len:230 (-) Transcript_21917:892-1581(-)
MHPGTQSHNHLTIKPIHHPPMSGNQGIEILHVVRPLNGRCEESTKWRDEGGEEREGDGVKLDGDDGESQLVVVMALVGRAGDAGCEAGGEFAGVKEVGCDGRGGGGRHVGGRVAMGAYFDNVEREQMHHRSGKEFEDLMREVGGRLVEDVFDFAFQFLGEEYQLVGGACHPGELCEISREIPANDDCEYSSADEAFPCFVGTQGHEGASNELSPHGDSGEVGHDVVGDD